MSKLIRNIYTCTTSKCTYQILICVSVNCKRSANSKRRPRDMYSFRWNSTSKRIVCSLLKVVRCRLGRPSFRLRRATIAKEQCRRKLCQKFKSKINDEQIIAHTNKQTPLNLKRDKMGVISPFAFSIVRSSFVRIIFHSIM